MSADVAPVAADGPVRSGPHVVVGVDGSAGGWSALAWARDEAAATGGRLTICRAGKWPAGDPVEVLRTVANGADEVVVGVPEPPRHHGSTAVRMAIGAPMPVVVARPAAGGTGGPFTGHVLAAVAGATVDGPVLEFAFRYARAHRLPLSAVHVTPHLDDDYWFDEWMRETHFVEQPGALEVPAAAVEPFQPRYPQVPVRLAVLAGAPLPRLLRASAGACLTVVGRRTRWHGNRLPGSVTHAMTIAGDGPLAIVPVGWRQAVDAQG